jgi:hypothetical protein
MEQDEGDYLNSFGKTNRRRLKSRPRLCVSRSTRADVDPFWISVRKQALQCHWRRSGCGDTNRRKRQQKRATPSTKRMKRTLARVVVDRDNAVPSCV